MRVAYYSTADSFSIIGLSYDEMVRLCYLAQLAGGAMMEEMIEGEQPSKCKAGLASTLLTGVNFTEVAMESIKLRRRLIGK
jgi:hypothetical protein